MKFLITCVCMSVSCSVSAMLPRQAVKSIKGSTRRIAKKSPTVPARRYAAFKASGVKGATVAEYGAPVAAAQKQAVASSYWSRAYANMALASGSLWSSLKNMFSRPQLNYMKSAQPINVKKLTAPDISALVASNPEIIKNANAGEMLLPTMTEQEAIAVVAQDALNDIEKAHKEQNLPLVEKGLMVCTPPGINSALLLEFDSIEAIQSYFKKRRHEIDLNYRDIEGMDDVAFNEYLAKRDREHEYLKTYYKYPNPKVFHDDEDLPLFILEETKRLLRLVGINPSSVTILNTTGRSTGCARGPDLVISNDEIFISQPAYIGYDGGQMSRFDHELIIFVIAHEIGHLLRYHHYSVKKYPMTGEVSLESSAEYMQKKMKKIAALEKLDDEKDLLQALEADVTVALLNKEIAQVINQYLLRSLATPRKYNVGSTDENWSKIHSSTNDKYLWIQRINELHKKEKKRSEL